MIAQTETTPGPAGAPARNRTHSFLIRKAAVLGAGTMGSRIAAHLANAGLPVVLLDIPAQEGPRSGIAAQALEGLKKTKPAAFFEAAAASRITTGNFDDDLAMLADCDWVIEAVTENLAIKQALLAKIAPHLKADAILTTNTSGLPVASIAASVPENSRRRCFGTHFFNPPRYMRLVEIITTPETDPAAVEAISHFADLRLGKDVVFARDTPNFIANRIGVFIMLEAVRLMQSEDLTIEEVDALTGTAIGWPRTGTFRLADLVGLDVLAHVASNFPSSLASGHEDTLRLPPFVEAMLERAGSATRPNRASTARKRTRRARTSASRSTGKHSNTTSPRGPSCRRSRWRKTWIACRSACRNCLSGDVAKDKAARFHWKLLSALWNYAADCLPEIADDVASIDRAMRAGFNWEMGPFELWDAAGFSATVARMQAAGESVSAVASRALAGGATGWYRDQGRECFDLSSAKYKPIVHAPRHRQDREFPRFEWRRAPEPGRFADRSRRRRGVPRNALQEERHRRGHCAPGDRHVPSRQRRRAQLLRIRGVERRRSFLRRREPDAAAAERAGGRMGRRRLCCPRLPAHDLEHQVLPASSRGRAIQLLPRRRNRDRAARRASPGRMPNSTWGWSRPASASCPPAAGAKELTMQAIERASVRARRRQTGVGGTAGGLAPQLRDYRDGQGFDVGRWRRAISG